MITTVRFDMDGTVLNTLDDLAASVNYVLTRYGMPVHCTEDYRRYFGNGIRYALQCAVPKGTEEAAIDQMLPVFREHYNAHCLDKTRPYDGIQELMKALRDRGYKLAIVSNKIDSAVKELNAKFFSDYVDVAISYDASTNKYLRARSMRLFTSEILRWICKQQRMRDCHASPSCGDFGRKIS